MNPFEQIDVMKYQLLRESKLVFVLFGHLKLPGIGRVTLFISNMQLLLNPQTCWCKKCELYHHFYPSAMDLGEGGGRCRFK